MALLGSKHQAGEFCWTDLAAPDAAAAGKFYKGLFGWKAQVMPTPEGEYHLLKVGTKDACALYDKKGEKKPAWMPYVCVKSVEETVKKALAAKGRLLSPARDVMDRGRTATIQDPTGGAVGLWQPGTRLGAGIEGKPGGVSWHDLNTKKPKEAIKFYTKVFGWTLVEQDFGGNPYYQLTLGKKPACGIWPFPLEALPACWVTYYQVRDAAKAAAQAKKLGAKVLFGPIDVPDAASFAILADPQGAAFGVMS